MGIVLNCCQYGVLYLGSYYNTGPYINFLHFGNRNLGKLPYQQHRMITAIVGIVVKEIPIKRTMIRAMILIIVLLMIVASVAWCWRVQAEAEMEAALQARASPT